MHALRVLITVLVKHWYLCKLQVYWFCRKVVGIHEQDFKKIGRFLYKNLPAFTGTFDDLHFPTKTVKFSCKNWQIFSKKL